MKNKMEKSEYINKHLFWGIPIFIFCSRYIFRCTNIPSFLLYLVVVGILLGVGVAFTIKKGRNNANVVHNISITFGIMVIFIYLRIIVEQVLIIGCIVCVLSTIVTFIILFRKISNQDKKRLIIKRRLQNVVNVWRRNMSLGYMVLVIPICISILFSGTMLSPELEVTKVYGEEHSLDAQIEEISKIEPSTWDTLDVQEKLNVCQIIVNAEAWRLGIPHEVKVGTAYLEIGNLAYYQDKDYQIVIDSDYLYSSSSGYDICEVLIHECAHAYQHEIVEIYEKLDESERNLLMFHDSGKYLEEFRNYKSGSANFEKYYEQLTETHARLAAEEGIVEYKEKIEEYLSEKGKE